MIDLFNLLFTCWLLLGPPVAVWLTKNTDVKERWRCVVAGPGMQLAWLLYNHPAKPRPFGSTRAYYK